MKELLGSRKKIMAGLCAFLAFMLICTLISKGIYASRLPQVTVEKPKKMSINHEVKASGNVKQSRELAVNVPGGLRVREVMVMTGDRVEEGSPLFLLDTEFLDEQIRDMELAQKKLQLQMATLQNNLALMGEEKDREMNRAGEDAVRSAQQADKNVSRALEDEAAAKEALAGHEANPAERTSDSDREKKEGEYNDWKKSLDEANEERNSAAKKVSALQKRIELLKLDIESLKKQIAEAGGTVISGGGGAPVGENGAGGQPESEKESESGQSTAPPESDTGGGQTESEKESESGQSTTPPESDAGGGQTESVKENESGGSTPAAEESESGTPDETGGGSFFATERAADLTALKAELAQKEAELLQAQKELAQANEDLSRAGNRVSSLQENAVAKPDFTAEDARQEAWENEKKSLQDALKAADRAAADALDQRDGALTDAGRKLEDSLTPETADSTLGLYRLEYQKNSEDIEKLKELKKAEGVIAAQAPGTITRVSVFPGEATTAGAAIAFADTAQPLQFEVFLDKDQKKYVNQGADARLALGGDFGAKADVTVDYLTESETSPGSYTALMTLPEGVGTIGQSGTFTLNTQSDSFGCCIPIDGLHTDENQRSFVYVLGEKDGILGKELSAQKIMVEVLDKNNRYAALAEGAIDAESQIICSATEEFSDGDIVRMKE